MMAIGLVLGAIGAYVGQRLIRGLLFGVGASDLWSLVASVAVLACVALCASFIPARHAARIDPIAALRHE
jgi:ABC-type antimicrobial peptide transport system permease subunit